MLRKETWHSVRQNVYHNNRDCTEGNNIEPWHCAPGTGGRRLCKRCRDLNEYQEGWEEGALRKVA